jgi:2,4-diketo-3-deoxy-L-fuconate hydrolase
VKLVSYRKGYGPIRAGRLDGESIRDIGSSLWDQKPNGDLFALEEVTLFPPVIRPGKVIGIGLNYVDHALESKQDVPDWPVVFAKFSTSLIGPDEPILLPPQSREVDYEAELAVIIGESAKDVEEERALDVVLGYACANDVSARDVQFADGQWVRGKSFDSFCPFGPWILTSDELPDPQSLAIRCSLNGVVVQKATTGDMIFSVAKLISYLSHGITLEPGDVILTGTPPGVGFARTPPVFMQDGDVVVVEIEGLGQLKNPVRRNA